MKNLIIVSLILISLLLTASAIYMAACTEKGSEVWGWFLFVGFLFGHGAGRAVQYFVNQEGKDKKTADELANKFNAK